MNRLVWIVIVALLLKIIVAFFFPKEYVVGGLGGLVGPGQSSYKEEYECFGIKHEYNLVDCADCGIKYYCYGWIHSKKCFTETATLNGVVKEPTLCKSF